MFTSLVERRRFFGDTERTKSQSIIYAVLCKHNKRNEWAGTFGEQFKWYRWILNQFILVESLDLLQMQLDFCWVFWWKIQIGASCVHWLLHGILFQFTLSFHFTVFLCNSFHLQFLSITLNLNRKFGLSRFNFMIVFTHLLTTAHHRMSNAPKLMYNVNAKCRLCCVNAFGTRKLKEKQTNTRNQWFYCIESE